MSKRATQDDAWKTRMSALLRNDIVAAENILTRANLEPGKVHTWLAVKGWATVPKRNCPAELLDQNNPCHWAAQLLLRKDELIRCDPMSLQAGRFWGFASKGMQIEAILTGSRAYLLARNKGHGGDTLDDLSKSLRWILERKPDSKVVDVWNFLESPESEELFGSVPRSIFITDIEIDRAGGLLSYSTVDRKGGKIKKPALERRLRRLRRT